MRDLERRTVAAARRATEMTKRRFRSGRRRDPSTPGPETSAVAPKRGHKTGEMGGGREDEGPGVGTSERTEGEARSGNGERVGNRPDRKMSRLVIRPDQEAKQDKGEAGAG